MGIQRTVLAGALVTMALLTACGGSQKPVARVVARTPEAASSAPVTQSGDATVTSADTSVACKLNAEEVGAIVGYAVTKTPVDKGCLYTGSGGVFTIVATKTAGAGDPVALFKQVWKDLETVEGLDNAFIVPSLANQFDIFRDGFVLTIGGGGRDQALVKQQEIALAKKLFS